MRKDISKKLHFWMIVHCGSQQVKKKYIYREKMLQLSDDSTEPNY